MAKVFYKIKFDKNSVETRNIIFISLTLLYLS